jgi:hypothetical protein
MSNKRSSEPPIPPNFERYLTPKQRYALNELESLGWGLAIIRRPKFKPTEVIVKHRSGKHCLLKENGELDYKNSPRLRRQPVKKQPVDDGPDPWANANDDSGFVASEDEPEEPTQVNNEPLPKGNPKDPGKFIV